MCGIAGIVDLTHERKIDPTALRAMASRLVHRGPDGEGFYEAPGIGLAHRRLAIIDLEGSAQPFTASSHHHHLTYNGEIYNYRALAQALSAAGFAPRTQGDTEILAEGLAREGHSFVEKVQGMFAFGFWDDNQKTLTLGRDRLGEKPLYYAQSKDGFLVFASEIDAILASGLIEAPLNPRAVADYFYYGYVPDPYTIYSTIHKLPPATILQVQRGKPVQLSRYWTSSFHSEQTLSDGDAAEQMRTHLDRAVQSQMISDVPLGAFLSGGVDSSAIVTSMVQSNAKPITCSIGFEQESHDERQYARQVAQQYQTNHQEDVANLDVMAAIDPVAQCYGEPFADSSALPTWLVSKLARQHVTVALSGDGSDEIFAGYRRYQFYLAEEKMRRTLPGSFRRTVFGPLAKAYPKFDNLPRPLRFKTTFQALSENSIDAYARASAIMLPEFSNALLSADLKQDLHSYSPTDHVRTHIENSDARTPLARALAADQQLWLAGRMLVKVDRASMAHSLEVRPPFLDPELVSWALNLPDHHKLRNGIGKHVLKDGLSERLPASLLHRKKQGFGLPVSDWLRRDGDNPLERLEASSHWRDSGLIDEKTVQQMSQDHRNGRGEYAQPLWSVIMFDAFLANKNE